MCAIAKRLGRAALLGLIVMAAGRAEAGLRTRFEFEGKIVGSTLPSDPALTSIQEGMTISGFFVVDGSAPLATSNTTAFDNATYRIVDLRLTLGDFAATAAPATTPGLVLSDSKLDTTPDSVAASFAIQSNTVGAYRAVTFDHVLSDSARTALAGTGFPDPFPGLAAFNSQRNMVQIFNTDTGSIGVIGYDITSLRVSSVTVVPEPSGLILCGTGVVLGIVDAMRRRRAKVAA